MPVSIFPWGHWVVWRYDLNQHPTDALANWKAKAGQDADVTWTEVSTRLENNQMVFSAIPILSCIKCHPLINSNGNVITLKCADRGRIERMSTDRVRRWQDENRAYEHLDHWPNVSWDGRQYVVSIMIRYKLNYLPIQDCEGTGSKFRTAKADAARKLLLSGHCMLRLR